MFELKEQLDFKRSLLNYLEILYTQHGNMTKFFTVVYKK